MSGFKFMDDRYTRREVFVVKTGDSLPRFTTTILLLYSDTWGVFNFHFFNPLGGVSSIQLRAFPVPSTID